MTTLTTINPVAVSAPRAAAWAAAAWMGASHSWTKLRLWAGQRAENASTGGRVNEANRLRHVAQGFMSSDSRFAADLFAAADRHERGE